ncbi:hypothetical protein MPER_12544 [Moniliophthora perniciosa FA553]|nr:hypothetical protein MPER_12544 [Moniliophthora perniciosa FA553]
MTTFCVLVAPLPYKVRRSLFRFLSESELVGKVAYALKTSFIISEMARSGAGGAGVGDVRTETNLAARKFYAQRNTYLTGFTLFLSLVLTRTFYITLDLIHVQEEYAKIKDSGATKGKESPEYAALKRDFDTLKNQAKSQAKEYDRLSDTYNELTGERSKTGKDKKGL